jgi:hypothetical protein
LIRATKSPLRFKTLSISILPPTNYFGTHMQINRVDRDSVLKVVKNVLVIQETNQKLGTVKT